MINELIFDGMIICKVIGVYDREEILHLIQSKEIEPLFIEHPCYLKSEIKQDEKMWEYIKKLNAEEREYKL